MHSSGAKAVAKGQACVGVFADGAVASGPAPSSSCAQLHNSHMICQFAVSERSPEPFRAAQVLKHAMGACTQAAAVKGRHHHIALNKMRTSGHMRWLLLGLLAAAMTGSGERWSCFCRAAASCLVRSSCVQGCARLPPYLFVHTVAPQPGLIPCHL